MPFDISKLTRSLTHKDITFLILLTVLGIAGNYFKLEIFFNVDFLFGSIFAIYAVKRYGMAGVIPAFIASLYTYTLWNHPYAIIIFTSEALFIAYFNKKDTGVILLDLFYWLTAGAALIFITYGLVMKMPMETVKLIVLKQSVNGVTNALCAVILMYGINYGRKILGFSFKHISFRQTFFVLILIIAAIPAIGYVIIGVKNQANRLTEYRKNELNAMYNMTSISVESLLDEAYGKLDSMAENVAAESLSESPENADSHIRTVLKSSDIFIGLAFLNPEAKANRVFIKIDRDIRIFDNVDFSSAEYYKKVASSDGIYVSDAIASPFRPSGSNIVLIVKSVKNHNGKSIGFVQGSIDFNRIANLMKSVAKDSGVILALSGKDGKMLINTAANPMEKAATFPENYRSYKQDKRGIFLSSPVPEHNTSVMALWNKSFYVKSMELAPSNLKLTAKMPLKEHVKKINGIGYQALKIIYLVIILCVMAAFIISRQISYHLETLKSSTKQLALKIQSGQNTVPIQSVFSEVTDLSNNFSNISVLLAEKFAEISRQRGELELIMDSIPLIIFVKDTNNRIITGNKAAAARLGVTTKDIRDINVYEQFPYFADQVYHNDMKVISSKEPILGIMQNYKGENGDMFVKTDKIPILNDEGSVSSILVISRDITDDLKAQEEKQRTLETLYQQSKMAEMGAMTAAIAHQWKQPLSTVSILAQMIESDLADGTLTNESLTTYTGLMLKNTDFMSQTADDFTQFFKTEKEKQMFRPCETVSEVYGIIDSQFRKLNISVTVMEHAHFSIYGYKNEFKQVCLNMLINAKDALSASDRQNKWITVSFGKEDTYRTIIFEDNGGGIPKEMLPDKLFEMYQTSKGDKGTGIGLYICKSIIETHMNGKITVENTSEGAKFTVYIPADQTFSKL